MWVRADQGPALVAGSVWSEALSLLCRRLAAAPSCHQRCVCGPSCWVRSYSRTHVGGPWYLGGWGDVLVSGSGGTRFCSLAVVTTL